MLSGNSARSNGAAGVDLFQSDFNRNRGPRAPQGVRRRATGQSGSNRSFRPRLGVREPAPQARADRVPLAQRGVGAPPSSCVRRRALLPSQAARPPYVRGCARRPASPMTGSHVRLRRRRPSVPPAAADRPARRRVPATHPRERPRVSCAAAAAVPHVLSPTRPPPAASSRPKPVWPAQRGGTAPRST